MMSGQDGSKAGVLCIPMGDGGISAGEGQQMAQTHLTVLYTSALSMGGVSSVMRILVSLNTGML